MAKLITIENSFHVNNSSILIKVVLVELGTVGAEEAVLGEAASTIRSGSADVGDLALGLGVSVVASVHLAITSKSGLRDLGIDGVILSGDSGHGFL